MKARRAGIRRASARRSAARAKRSGESKAKIQARTKPDFASLKISDFYRPLKKPITVRIDADVLAWFKKDGKRYQSRINAALRKVMEKEMKGNK